MTMLPALPGQRIKVFDHVDADDARRIWCECSLEMAAFVKTLWYTGLRISEVLRLRTTDLKGDGQEYSLVVTRSNRNRD